MTTTILVGPCRSGKTTQCMRRIQEQAPFSERWVIVPDRIHAGFVVQRLSVMGGALGVRIGTFSDFYASILRHQREIHIDLSELDVYRILRTLLPDELEQGNLKHAAAIAGKAGFVRALREQIAELQAAHIEPKSFFIAARKQEETLLVEMASLYARYQGEKRRHRLVDVQDSGRFALDVLRRCPERSDLACIVVDGFDSFSGLQLAVLQEIHRLAGEMWITLPGDEKMERPIFRRFRRARRRLQETLPEAQVLVLQGRGNELPASLLNSALFEPEQDEMNLALLSMMEVRSPSHEAREALRWMKARILRDGVNPAACALVVPDVRRYRDGVVSAAREFGIPITFLSPQSLTDAPLTATVLSLLSFPLRNWPRREFLDILTSPFLNFGELGIQPEDVPLLKAVAIYGQILEGKQDWQESLSRLEQRDVCPDREEAGLLLPAGGEARRLREGLEAIFGQFDSLSGTKSGAEWTNWLQGVLTAFQIENSLHSDDELGAFDSIRETSRAISQPLPGVSDLYAYIGFVEELQRALALAHWDVTQPEDAISVVQPSQARSGSYMALAVLGLSEGSFPVVEREDPFLPDDLRNALDLQPRLGQEQRGLYYQVLTRSARHLLLTRPYLSDVGAPWEASPYWKATRPFASGEVQRLASEAPRALNDAASYHEVMLWSARRGEMWKPLQDEMEARWSALLHALSVMAQRVGPLEISSYDGDLGEMSEALRARYHSDHVWSASRLERYGQCPFFFFVNDVLALEPIAAPEPGYDALQLGSLLHELLERSYREAASPEDPDEVVGVLHAIAEKVFEQAPTKYGFKPTALWDTEKLQWLEALEETIRNLQKEQHGWQPIAFERSFGLHGEPPLELDVEGEMMRLRGVVDRVDRASDGCLCVIDYKTGSSDLDRRALEEGRKLQLPIYALAAQKMGLHGEATEGFYWIISSAKRGSLRLSRYRPSKLEVDGEGLPAAIEATHFHLERIRKGIHRGHFPPIPPRNGCPAYCPAAGWCWRYTPGWGL